MSGAFTLERIPDIDCVQPCAKCLVKVRNQEQRGLATGCYLLKQGASSWPLCANHAAHACHVHGIRHPTFNPAPADQPKE